MPVNLQPDQTSNIFFKTRVAALSAVWRWNFRCLYFHVVVNPWIVSLFSSTSRSMREPDTTPFSYLWSPTAPATCKQSLLFLNSGTLWTWPRRLEQFRHKLEYCTVGSLRLRLWRRLFTGVTPPDREESGLVRKGVGHWIIFRAVATPVPTVYPIPSQQLKVKRQMLGQISHLACSNLLLIGPFYNLETFWQLHSLVWSSPSNKFFSRSN